MFNRLYLRRLRRDLPDWVSRGWVAPEHEPKILDLATAGGPGTRWVPYVLAILGVVLFGAGVITFFAANWQGMTKISKLVVLFGGMWLAYGGAVWQLRQTSAMANKFGEALLLLGAILFGANIMLIAQIYHIEEHAPNGVRLWVLGTLLLVYLVPSQAVALLGLGLSIVWTVWETASTESAGIDLHWPFLVVWAAFWVPIYRGAWRHAASGAMFALLIWIAVSIIHLVILGGEEMTDVLQVFFLVVTGFYLVGAIIERSRAVAPFAATVRYQSLVGALFLLFVLTFYQAEWTEYGGAQDPAYGKVWYAATVVLALLLAGLAGYLRFRIYKVAFDRIESLGVLLLAIIVVAFLANRPMQSSSEVGTVAIFIAFYVLYLASILWLILIGYRRGRVLYVNTGFAFFALGVLTLYFDTFWALFDRSLFFMGIGLLLFVGGYLIERQRRRLTAKMGTAQ